MNKENIWLLGPGSSLFYNKKEIKKLKNRTTIGFQKFFPNCVEHFDFYPKFWSFFDISTSINGLKYIIDTWKTKGIKLDMTIVGTHFHLEDDLKNIVKYGNPQRMVGRKKTIPFSEYRDKIEYILDNDLVKIQTFNTMTRKQIGIDKLKILPISDKGRFCGEYVYCGCNPVDCTSREQENKLTYFMLPLLHRMNFKNVYIAGFDGKGGRFYNLKNRIPPHRATFFFLHQWNNKWKKYTNMNLYSVIEDKYTTINKHIKYINFDKAYKNE